jgi:pyrimidine-specific ribonucleoside hydrolase
MDGGIDDALGLILGLKSPEIELVGITSVSGNVPVHQATLNALRVVELVDKRDVWVAEGHAKPLARDPIRAFDFHGRDGLGDSHLSPPKLRPANKDALKMMGETLSSSRKHGLKIVCTGPLTNIASLLKKTPDMKRQIGEIVLMGGAYGITEYGFGNETPVAEFNIFSDPEAAKAVFESGIELKAVGLDVTTIPRLELTAGDYSRIRKAKGKIAKFATRILLRNMRVHGRFTLHDPMAVAVAISPTLYKFSEYRVSIETKGTLTSGMTIADRRTWLPPNKLRGNKVMVCVKVDLGFKQLFLERLTVA